MNELSPVGQLAYSRQQKTDTVKNPANAEVHKDGATEVFVALHEYHENHDRDEHISTKYHKHVECND